MRLRDGQITKGDWETLRSRSPLLLDKPEDYDEITRLFFQNKEVHEYNLKKLKELQSKGVPIAKVLGDHAGDKVAQRATPDDAWGLKPVLYLAQGAKVMLKINVLQKFGLVNGSQGKIIDII